MRGVREMHSDDAIFLLTILCIFIRWMETERGIANAEKRQRQRIQQRKRRRGNKSGSARHDGGTTRVPSSSDGAYEADSLKATKLRVMRSRDKKSLHVSKASLIM